MQPKLIISSVDSYIDEDVMVSVSGCVKDSKVTIHATTYDEEGKKFSSYATFIADQNGNINLSLEKPVAGTYDQADVSGLFWSMEDADSRWGDYFEKRNAEKVSFDLDLIVDGEKYDSLTIHRYFYKDGVVKESVHHDKIRGTLFHPEEEGGYPAVIILSGSDGGMQEHAAALLASKGYTTFALSYFGAEGVPKDLENISLEYFQEATLWLKNHTYVNGEISLIGYSRGAELALILGATYDDYKSIIAGAPSAYVTAGMKNGIFAPVASWTLDKNALPYIKFKYRFSTLFSMVKNWIRKMPISYLSIWDNSLKDQEAIKQARIPVENINVPILLISGKDDQLWPSSLYVKMMEEKLKISKKSQQHRYLYYENAGHFLSFPYSFGNLPANVFMQVGGEMTMTFGGTKQANAEAAKDSWNKILDFLDQSRSNSNTILVKMQDPL